MSSTSSAVTGAAPAGSVLAEVLGQRIASDRLTSETSVIDAWLSSISTVTMATV